MFLHVSVILFTVGGGGGLPHCMLGYTPSRIRSRHPPGAEVGTPGSRHPSSTVHAGRYGQESGGTHPTRMQSSLESKHRKTEEIAFSTCSVNKPYTTDLHSALWEVCSEFVQTLRTDPAARTAVTLRHCYTGSPPTVITKPINYDYSLLQPPVFRAVVLLYIFTVCTGGLTPPTVINDTCLVTEPCNLRLPNIYGQNNKLITLVAY